MINDIEGIDPTLIKGFGKVLMRQYGRRMKILDERRK
jgi:hypothetical protein